jgi:tyrosinase
MVDNARLYEPPSNEGPDGHRVDDIMVALLGDAMRPQELLDPSPWYSYDTLTVD